MGLFNRRIIRYNANMVTRPTFHDCDKCQGTGQLSDDVEMGAWFREQRSQKGVKQGELGRRLGISRTHMHDLELGRRRWTLDIERRAVLALGLETTPR